MQTQDKLNKEYRHFKWGKRHKGIIFHPSQTLGIKSGLITETYRRNNEHKFVRMDGYNPVLLGANGEERIHTCPMIKYGPTLFLKERYDSIRSESAGYIEILDYEFMNLKDITDESIKACGFNTLDEFVLFWESVNKRTYRWSRKPWVWRYQFKYIGETL